MIEPGTALPAFETHDHLGHRVTNEDLAGSWAVLWWFVKADTPG